MSKKTSVCIATYNGELHVEAQLKSILESLDMNDEIVISDDNSTDKTVDKVRSINDPRIRVVYNAVANRGHIRNFENALKHATGDYLFLSDQDDIWHPDKLSKMLLALEKNDIVICDCVVVDGDMITLNKSFFKLFNSGNGLIKNFFKNTYLGCCMAFNRRILEKALPFPKDIISHDSWLGLMGEIYGSSVFIPEKLHSFIRHGSNFSITDGADAMNDQISPYSFKEKITMRLVLLKNILIRIIKNKFSKKD